ncbi:MAG: chromosomal replication initiator protein DnaA [Anaerolineae bacterium]|nr:chromosomal replication initiator protein DnaA [Anaerolineae bacterium]
MNPQEAWSAAAHQLELQLDRASYDTWLRDAVLLGVEGDVFVIGVANSYARDMLQHRLYRNVRRILAETYGAPVELRFEVAKSAAPVQTPGEDAPLFRLLEQNRDILDSSVPLHERLVRPGRVELPESELNPRFTFERFIPGGENQMVYAAAHSVAERPGGVYNPFFVYGGVGLGKTHLLQAVAHFCKARGLRTVYVPSEAFTNDLVDSIRSKSTAVFRDRYRSVDVLLIDDIQFIAGKESTQEEFFHTFNALNTYNKQIVIASDRPPRDLQPFEERLRSRFQGGLVMEVIAPSYETRLAILRNWAADRGVELPAHVIEMIAGRSKMNVRELEGVFNQVAATQHLARRAITPDMTADILDGYRRPREHVTLTRVLEVTARQYGLNVTDLTGKSRTGKINQARQVAMYLARDMTAASLPQIGDAFGRTHSTVLHACNKMLEDLQSDPHLKLIVHDIRERIVNFNA